MAAQAQPGRVGWGFLAAARSSANFCCCEYSLNLWLMLLRCGLWKECFPRSLVLFVLQLQIVVDPIN